MKRDMELVREVLLKLEALPMRPGSMVVISGHDEDMSIDGHTPDEVDYHMTMLRDAGFLDSPGSQPAGRGITFRSLSWEGHDFLDAVRSPEVWKRTKEGASTVGGWTFGLVKDMATAYAKHIAKERLGLDLSGLRGGAEFRPHAVRHADRRLSGPAHPRSPCARICSARSVVRVRSPSPQRLSRPRPSAPAGRMS